MPRNTSDESNAFAENVLSSASNAAPFLLKFQERIGREPGTAEVAVHAGTRTVTEVRSEGGDEDPTATNHFAFAREE